jgi:tetratricopeptide (TPR) repeat protein
MGTMNNINKDKAISVLLSVFPTPETFSVFAENNENGPVLKSFLDYAARNEIIVSPDSEELIDFIRQHSRSPEDCTPPVHLTFEGFLENKEELLSLNVSIRALTDRINQLLGESAIDLPRVSNTMLTRLKKEPVDTTYKQNVLRSLAFWLGHERSDLGFKWNYETLLKLCRESRPADQNYAEGVRIGFALYSRGEVIDHEIVGWLKKSLKQYIEENISHFAYGRWGKVRSHDITTLYVDFPKEDIMSDPAAYRPCLRSASSLAHQIAIRWALSKYCTKNRFLAIGVAAGEYATLDNYLLPVLNAKLPGDPVIRLTDYVRQCLLINDIHAILCERPFETVLFNGEALSIWWIVGFWSTLYFDFIPELLEDPILKNDQAARDAIIRLLYFQTRKTSRTEEDTEPNAVKTFFKFPHNALLGIEIAKTLYYRRRFREALEVLRIVLSINPTDLTARTLRMILLRNLALDAPSYAVSEVMLQSAEQEAMYIEKNCTRESEDYYCEYAVVHLVKAMLTLRYTRLRKGVLDDRRNLEGMKQIVFSALETAEFIFGRGISVSPLPIRSFYLYVSVKILREVLLNDESLFIDPQKSLNGKPENMYRPYMDTLWQIDYGWNDLPARQGCDFLEHLTITRSDIHDDSVALEAYRPTTYFCHAVALWDFLPVRTVATAKRTLTMLRGAREKAQLMAEHDVCIYSFTRTYGEMMPVKEFVQHMEKSIKLIEENVGKDLYLREDREIIDVQGERSSLLMTLNF